MTAWIRWFDDIGMDDVSVVGGKKASLGARSGSAARLPATIPSLPSSWDQGIDSLSLNPDSLLKTMLAIVEVEKTLAQGGSAAAASV
jgi:phosphoenolpyruvate synthase/pyruvate phosphate dikinase